ncbi:YutD family protein [Lactobacillus xylocopicola]|uniref:Transcriptional regulator n=1 Tax=Lactobacillus xylocopicola TaxID=2976676 RepID=A0ABM8BFR8_9LACO|nr:YutD family protein [Lactobacillus xylocopicola]BDR60100.1 transcriptional regulator [Lactobacillus xylocopicola]
MTENHQQTDSPNSDKENKFAQKQPLRHPQAKVVLDEATLKINQQVYQVLVNKQDALDLDSLRQKYDPYLNQYDFLVGDISSEHLRLKGFFQDNVQAAIDRKKQTIADYLIEYCNPGSPYFILQLLSPVHHYRSSKRKKIRTGQPSKRANNSLKAVRRVRPTQIKKQPGNHHNFIIRKRRDSN